MTSQLSMTNNNLIYQVTVIVQGDEKLKNNLEKNHIKPKIQTNVFRKEKILDFYYKPLSISSVVKSYQEEMISELIQEIFNYATNDTNTIKV